MHSRFYEIDSTRVTLAEYWWESKSPVILIAALLKALKVRIPGSSDDANTDSLLPFVVDALPSDVAARFDAPAPELASLRFHNPIFHIIHDPGTRTTIHWATFRHETGVHFARIHHRLWQKAQKADRGLFLLFFTEFTDGTFL